jgi:hypothetical protein
MRARLVDQLVQVRLLHDVRGRNQDVIAPAAVDRSPHRIAKQPILEGLPLQPGMDASLGVEWGLGPPVRNQLEGPEEATTPDVADIGVSGKPLLKQPAQPAA